MTFIAKLNHPARDFNQDAIARSMSPGIVNKLEIITVEEEQALAHRYTDEQGQLLHEVLRKGLADRARRQPARTDQSLARSL